MPPTPREAPRVLQRLTTTFRGLPSMPARFGTGPPILVMLRGTILVHMVASSSANVGSSHGKQR